MSKPRSMATGVTACPEFLQSAGYLSTRQLNAHQWDRKPNNWEVRAWLSTKSSWRSRTIWGSSQIRSSQACFTKIRKAPNWTYGIFRVSIIVSPGCKPNWAAEVKPTLEPVDIFQHDQGLLPPLKPKARFFRAPSWVYRPKSNKSCLK